MTYLLVASGPRELASTRLRALLAREEIVRMPGAHNGMAALQAEAAGFEALYLSGAAMSASMGLPDIGIMTADDVAFFLRQITRVSALPVLVDADTGFGETMNVMQTVRLFELAGAAAIQLEDQTLPKKCGHLDDKRLVPAAEMAAKIIAARHASREIVIVARTDAAASEGVDGAVARARRYVAAGADVIFVEALTSREEFAAVARALSGVALLANMTEFGKTPYLDAATFAELGYRIVIWPVSSLRVANFAQRELYATLARDGASTALLDRMQTRAELYTTIELSAFEELDRRIAGAAEGVE